jgi:uncharacterized protein (TIGR00297 family)
MLENLALSALISVVVAGLAYWRGSLSLSGAAAALVVGTLTLGFGGWIWGLLLGIFFVTSSLLSHYREAEKEQLSEKFDKSQRRDYGQVLANGGLGALIAFMNFMAPTPAWFLMFIGVMATVTADTWATELGTLSKKEPRLITSGQRVEVGSSGGVSLLGTLVSILGGLVIGLAAGLLDPLIEPAVGIVIGTLSGLIGSFVDSLLGATVQHVYYCEACQKETERKIHTCGNETRSLRGWYWLNNDLVNLISSMIGGIVAFLSWLLFF